jgi:hypothetical protein
MRFSRMMLGLACLACTFFLAGSAMAQGGELVRAEWGVPGNRVDVTARVRTFAHDGVLQFEATRFALGVDPAPHQNKDLVIRIRHWNGEVEEFKYPERSSVNLELDPEDRWAREEHDRGDRHDDDRRDDRRDDAYEHHERGLRILRAYYGAGGQFANVTDAVRSQVADGHLFFHVDNYSLGVDPLPGVHKWLRVLYVYDGERRNATVDEKTDLRLP